MKDKKVLIVKNVTREGPGLLNQVLKERNINFDIVDLDKKEKLPEVRFDKLGRVDIFCAIHTNMHCIILVLPNPFFAVADAKRRFVIKDVPAGTYRLRAWHERLPGQLREVVVPAQGDVKIDFVLGVAELPKL